MICVVFVSGEKDSCALLPVLVLGYRSAGELIPRCEVRWIPPLCQEMHFRLIGRKKFFTPAESPPQASKQKKQ